MQRGSISQELELITMQTLISYPQESQVEPNLLSKSELRTTGDMVSSRLHRQSWQVQSLKESQEYRQASTCKPEIWLFNGSLLQVKEVLLVSTRSK